MIGAGLLAAASVTALLLVPFFRRKLNRHLYGILLLCAANGIGLSVIFALCAVFFLTESHMQKSKVISDDLAFKLYYFHLKLIRPMMYMMITATGTT